MQPVTGFQVCSVHSIFDLVDMLVPVHSLNLNYVDWFVNSAFMFMFCTKIILTAQGTYVGPSC